MQKTIILQRIHNPQVFDHLLWIAKRLRVTPPRCAMTVLSDNIYYSQDKLFLMNGLTAVKFVNMTDLIKRGKVEDHLRYNEHATGGVHYDFRRNR